MKENYLLRLATDMLEATNPYKKPIKSFCYSFIQVKEQKKVSFLNLLEKELQGKHRSFRSQNPMERDYTVCYEAIAMAMISYIQDYNPQSYVFLQETKMKFSGWLKNIAETYGVLEQVEPELLRVNPYDHDTAIALLKALHPRKRVTVEEISEQMGIKGRAIQKNLKKLDPTWNPDSTGIQEGPFRIGGQPVEVKLDVKQPEKGKATLYRTTNTVHPLVLLENQMQIGTLLKSLAHSYYVEHSGVCYSIGLDIWYQLSAYSKERVKVYFASDDEDLQFFIEDLEDAVPNTMADGFQTERTMIERLGVASMSNKELLTYAVKGYGRHCNIIIKTPDGGLREMASAKLEYNRKENGEMVYIAYGSNNEWIEFREEDLYELKI